MEARKLFLSRDNKVTFTCNKCDRTKVQDMTKYLTTPKAIKMKMNCPCGHTNKYIIERRKFYRKEVNLPGIFVISADPDNFRIYGVKGNPDGYTVVKDVSKTGLRLEFRFPPNIKVGETMLIEFKLSDPQNTTIRKQVIVRTIFDKFYGVEFATQRPDPEMDKAIHYYLLSQ